MVRTTPVYTAIVDALKARIATGDWGVGHRLPSISQLAQEFKVGVGSIREAVKALESLGIIRIEHGRGMFVASANIALANPHNYFEEVGAGSILALCEARRILEPELAAFAAERATPAEAQAIREQALIMERLIAAQKDFLVPDMEFHRQIAQAAHNPVLGRMMDGVNDLLRESRNYTADYPGQQERAIRYHRLIADAIAEHNPLQARLLMLAHVNDTINILLTYLKIETQQANDASETAPIYARQRSLVPRVGD